MSGSHLRRTMVFIDGSAFRDTIQRFWHGQFRGRQELVQDYCSLGRLLCSEDQELIRVNYYTGRPVDIEELPPGADGEPRFKMGGMELHDHEAHRARRVLESHRKLEAHIKRCAYTRLATGRVVGRRRSADMDRHFPGSQTCSPQPAGSTRDRQSMNFSLIRSGNTWPVLYLSRILPVAYLFERLIRFLFLACSTTRTSSQSRCSSTFVDISSPSLAVATRYSISSLLACMYRLRIASTTFLDCVVLVDINSRAH